MFSKFILGIQIFEKKNLQKLTKKHKKKKAIGFMLLKYSFHGIKVTMVLKLRLRDCEILFLYFLRF